MQGGASEEDAWRIGGASSGLLVIKKLGGGAVTPQAQIIILEFLSIRAREEDVSVALQPIVDMAEVAKNTYVRHLHPCLLVQLANKTRSRRSGSSKDAPTNPRGIPFAPFVDRVEDYVSSRADVEGALKSFQEMISYVAPHARRSSASDLHADGQE